MKAPNGRYKVAEVDANHHVFFVADETPNIWQLVAWFPSWLRANTYAEQMNDPDLAALPAPQLALAPPPAQLPAPVDDLDLGNDQGQESPVQELAQPSDILSETASDARKTKQARLRRLWQKDISTDDIAAKLGWKVSTLQTAASRLGLGKRPDPWGNPNPRKPKHHKATRRFTEKIVLDPENVMGLDLDHQAITSHQTLFPSTVIDPGESPRLLVSGHNSRKLGRTVAKGAWRGMPIFSLTLEERATCPDTCEHWATCYGNQMPRARRHRHGPELEKMLGKELHQMQEMYPGGFVVRLHQLGDFYSEHYANCWGCWVAKLPAMRVFGYTAWPKDSKIGAALLKLRDEYWSRFAIRFSVKDPGPGDVGTLWTTPQADTIEGGIVCPAQTGKTGCCGSCGLCWSEAFKDRWIHFVAYGHFGRYGPRPVRVAKGAREKRPAKVMALQHIPVVSEPQPEPVLVPGREIGPLAQFDSLKSRRCNSCGGIFQTNGVHSLTCDACRGFINGRSFETADGIRMAADPGPDPRATYENIMERRCVSCPNTFKTNLINQVSCPACRSPQQSHAAKASNRTQPSRQD